MDCQIIITLKSPPSAVNKLFSSSAENGYPFLNSCTTLQNQTKFPYPCYTLLISREPLPVLPSFFPYVLQAVC